MMGCGNDICITQTKGKQKKNNYVELETAIVYSSRDLSNSTLIVEALLKPYWLLSKRREQERPPLRTGGFQRAPLNRLQIER